MALWAMGRGGIARRNGFATHYVFTGRHSLKVGWIAASAIAAEVVDLQAARDRPVDGFIGQAVNQLHSRLNTDLRITACVFGVGAFPTSGVRNRNPRRDPAKHAAIPSGEQFGEEFGFVGGGGGHWFGFHLFRWSLSMRGA